MTDNTPPANARDARAQAKADKAYAKARRPWYKKKRFLLPLALIVLILIIVVATLSMSGGDGNNTADSTSNPTTSTDNEQMAEPENSSAAFPGAQPSDVIGQADEALVLGDIAVTSTMLVPGDATLGPTLCTTVTVQNGSNETINFNVLDWKLQAPSGTISNTTFSGSENLLSAGQIAPGGTAAGDLCFENKSSETGQYIVLYEPIFNFFSDRGAWVNIL